MRLLGVLIALAGSIAIEPSLPNADDGSWHTVRIWSSSGIQFEQFDGGSVRVRYTGQ